MSRRASSSDPHVNKDNTISLWGQKIYLRIQHTQVFKFLEHRRIEKHLLHRLFEERDCSVPAHRFQFGDIVEEVRQPLAHDLMSAMVVVEWFSFAKAI